jgi:hypothetical protein
VRRESFRILWKLFATLGQAFSLLQGCQGQGLMLPANMKNEIIVTRLNRICYELISREIYFVAVATMAEELPLF